MNLKQSNIGIEKGRLKKSLSKRKAEGLKSQSKPSSPSNQRSPVIQFIVPSVKEMVENFEKEIVKPITFHKTVYNSGSPPKCILHNNILTLYCKNDNQLLCAGCIYSFQSHKTHKIMPFTKVQTELKDNFSENLIIAKKGLSSLEEAYKKNEENYTRTQDQYPSIIEKLHNFYLQLHENLVEKKNRQLDAITENWTRLRYTFNLKRVELQKIINYVKVHLDLITEKTPKENLLHYHTLALELAKAKHIVNDYIGKSQVNRFQKDIKHFGQIVPIIEKHLEFTNLYSLQKQLHQIKIQKEEKENPFAHHNKSLKKSTNGFATKSFLDSPKEASTYQKAEDLNTLSKSLHSKNRHSKSDLFRKQQVQQQLRLRKRDLQKQKSVKFLSQMHEKSKKEQFKKEIANIKSQKSQKLNKTYR